MARRSRIKAIPTVRKGYRFRSRAEARWSIIFDELGLAWDYEPEGFDLGHLGWYLPDFFVRYPNSRYLDAGYWIEVKGPMPTEIEIKKCAALTKITKHRAHIVYGTFNDLRCLQCSPGRLPSESDLEARFLPFVSDCDAFDAALIKARGARFGR